MAEAQLRTVVREAIADTDGLSRAAHGTHWETLSQLLDALRSELSRIDEALGGARPITPFFGDFDRLVARLSAEIERFTPALRRDARAAVRSLRALRTRLTVAPTRATSWRIPDSASGGLSLVALALARTSTARRAALVLGASLTAMDVLGRRRATSVRPPVDVQRVLEGLWGASSIAAPFAFGYRRREPLVTAMQLLAGASALMAALQGALAQPR